MALLIGDPEWGVSATAAEVYVNDAAAEATGLLSADGHPIYRVRETVPLGFHHTRATP